MNKQKNVMATAIGAMLVAVVLFGGATTQQQAHADYIGNDTAIVIENDGTAKTIQMNGIAPIDFFYIIQQPPSHGNLEYDGATGIASYTPNFNYTGPDSFTFVTAAVMQPHWFGDRVGTVTILVVNPGEATNVVVEQNPNNNPTPTPNPVIVNPIIAGSDSNWELFYAPIEKALKPYVGKDIPEADHLFNKYQSGTKAYIEYMHFDELTNRYAALGMTELSELQKTWLFEQIKPEIDGVFKWVK